MLTTVDRQMMARAQAIAKQGIYTARPNPCVGCVITQDNLVIGEGWHQKAGGPHAEVNALREAGDRAKGATVYVSLEPCSHHGRTPPCTDALIAAKVSRVVYGEQDPNPKVAGSGLKKLVEAGICVDGPLKTEAAKLNRGFRKRQLQGLPWVTVKLAMSLDGRTAMASGESQWITGPDARSDVQRLRAASCAVVTGIESVLQDNPSMTVRAEELNVERAVDVAQQQPLRVIVDSQLRTPPSAKLFSQPGPILIASAQSEQTKTAAAILSQGGAEIVQLEANNKVDLTALLKELANRECNSVLVEAGAVLAGAFVEAGLVDELVVYMAPKLLGSEARPLLQLPLQSMLQNVALDIVDIRAVGEDWRITAVPKSG